MCPLLEVTEYCYLNQVEKARLSVLEMPRLRLATLRRQSRDSARRFSRRSCARATAIAARLRLSENSLRSFKPLRGLRARSPSAPSPPPACAGTGRRVGRSHRPPCPRRRAPRVLAWRRLPCLCRFFAFFALAAQAGAPMQGLFTRWRSSLRVLRPCRLTQSNKTGILYNCGQS